MTTKQRNFWLAALALAAIVYVGPSFFSSRRIATAPQPEAKKPKVEAPATPPTSAPDAAMFNNLLGTWQGTAPLFAGMCSMKFELRRKADDPSRFAGFPVLLCVPMLPVPRSLGTNPLLAQMSPLSAVLSGTAGNSAIQFTVDRVIGKSVSGCAFTSFAVTPFGADQMSAEWQEGSCQEQPSGQILLRRTGK